MLLYYIKYLKLILYIYLIMDAEFIAPPSNIVANGSDASLEISQDQLSVNICFNRITFLETVKQDLKSKQLFKVLFNVKRYYGDRNLFNLNIVETSNNFELLLISKYDKEATKIRLILYRLIQIIKIISEYSSKKKFMKKIFTNFSRLYQLDLKLNVGDIVIYRKFNRGSYDKYLCKIKNITSKNYILEECYTNAKTFRKNLYGEEHYTFSMIGDYNSRIKQFELFDTVWNDKRTFRCFKNTIDKNDFYKLYKNNNGVYVGMNERVTQEFLWLYNW